MRALTVLAPLCASWMLVSLLLTVLLAASATLLHRLARDAFPTRLVWSAALLFSVALSFTQPWRRVESSTPSGANSGALSVIAPTVARTDWRSLVTRFGAAVLWPADALGTLTTDTSSLAASLARRAPAPVQLALVLLWPASSTAVLLLLVASYRRHRRVASRAEPQQLHEVPVRVSDEFGPLVIGATTADIIVPRWLLSRTSEEQQLVVQHERAHVEARDPLLLLAGCLAAASMPWNPACWFMLARLRLAIELDCDARMLARGASPRRYGQLLIELSAAPSLRSRLQSAPAFSYRASHLERRLHTMTARPTSFRGTRRVLALVVATTAALAACGSELPTSAELERMDVADAERRIGVVLRDTAPGTISYTVAPDSTATVYYVDGKRVAAAQAKAVTAERIATINIRRQDGGTNAVSILTRDTVAERASAETTPLRFSAKASSTAFDGLVIVDGVRASQAALAKIAPSSIETVEVVKGSAATARYGDAGANGVIVVTTKK